MTTSDLDALLARAIANHAIGNGNAEPDSLLDGYAVIAVWQPEHANGTHTYTTAFHTADVPLHVGLGLFELATRLVTDEPT